MKGNTLRLWRVLQQYSCFILFLLIKNLLCVILGVNRQKAQEWCIKHGFELVELSPEELPEEDGKYLCVRRKHGIWIQI